MKSFGIDRIEYECLLKAQNFVCAIPGCNRTHGFAGRPLVVDHCHDSGEIRGLLCDVHNTAIGKLGDNLSSILQVALYLSSTCQHKNPKQT
jgi:hypothetical protein